MHRYSVFMFALLGSVAPFAGEAMAVPAPTLDLSDTNVSEGTINGAIFRHAVPHPTGTGVINSFLRFEGNPANGSVSEQGYNSDYRNVEFDEKTDPNFTRSLKLGDVPIVNINGIDYREFFLDINEPAANNKSTISLDELRFYVSSDPSITGYDENTLKLGGLTAIWDMDTNPPGGDEWIKLDYNRNGGGSGSGDMVAYIPSALFGVDANKNVILYNKMGDQAGMGADKFSDPAEAGFEEWWVLDETGGGPFPDNGGDVPEPGTMTLWATGFGLAVWMRRRRKK